MNQDFVAYPPQVWGPKFWNVIHYILFSYNANSEVSKDFIELFFYALGGLLPCGECQDHYHSYFSSHNIKDSLSTKEDLFHWVYFLQKEIQTRNGKSFPTFDNWLTYLKSQHEFQNFL